jgi:hypothetical protein
MGREERTEVKRRLESIGFEQRALISVQADILEELKKYQESLRQGKIMGYAVLPSSTGGGGHEIYVLLK